MRINRLAVAIAAASSLVGACGSSSTKGATTTAAGAATTSATAGPTTTAAPAASGETIRLWLNGGDTPDDVVNFAVAEFAKIHPGVKVQFERQQWTGIVEKLTTALSSSDSPDVVELGNTQAQAFEAAGALTDLTAKKAELGGDDLLQSLVEAGTYDGKFFGAPYYAGARVVIYRKDLFQKSGLTVPTTVTDMLAAAKKLKADNAATPNFSGMYLPGKNWFEALPFIWMKGGDIATQDGGKWKGTLAADKSVAGLTLLQQFIKESSGAPVDGDDSKDYIAFCRGEVGMMPAPGWKPGQIINKDDGCPDMAANIGAFAFPGEVAGQLAPAFLGGSNIAVSAKSKHQDLAYDLVKLMTGADYQKKMAALGLLPARKSLLSAVSGSESAVAQAQAAQNSRFVPSSENWAAVEAAFTMQDLVVGIAGGGDVAAEAKKADDAITTALNG
jgi:N,N'-diacetylchitobiose transport system substrate-binding protein